MCQSYHSKFLYYCTSTHLLILQKSSRVLWVVLKSITRLLNGPFFFLVSKFTHQLPNRLTSCEMYHFCFLFCQRAWELLRLCALQKCSLVTFTQAPPLPSTLHCSSSSYIAFIHGVFQTYVFLLYYIAPRKVPGTSIKTATLILYSSSPLDCSVVNMIP